MTEPVIEGAMVAKSGANLPAHQDTFFDLAPSDMVAQASQIATVLKDIIQKQKMYTEFKGKKYVQVEGWNTMGAFLKVFPQEEKVELQADGSWVAYVKLVNSNGEIVGRASHICGDPTDRNWSNREAYAKRSMAITRATGKAFRLNYSWIMSLAGYEATPAEEMPKHVAVEVFNIDNKEQKQRLCGVLQNTYNIEDKETWKLVAESINGKCFDKLSIDGALYKMEVGNETAQ